MLASLAGFEPTAFRLGGERSILLSYGDIFTYLQLNKFIKKAVKCQGEKFRSEKFSYSLNSPINNA